MAVSSILNIELLAPTQGGKVQSINDAIQQLEQAANRPLIVDMSGGDVTLTFPQLARNAIFITGGLPADQKLTIPLVTDAAGTTYRVFLVRNISSFDLEVGGATGASVILGAGDAQVIECDGTDCVTYASGGPGPTGPRGPAGGAVDIAYAFSVTTTDTDPGSGKLQFDHGTQNLTTTIYVDLLDAGGTDWTAVLDSLDASTSAVKGQIRVFRLDDPTKWIVFDLTAVTTASGYRKLVVTPIGASAANPFAAADALSVSFTRTGDADTSILTANNYWTGSQTTILVPLLDTGTIAIDFDDGNNFEVTIAGNRLLGNPSNMPVSGRTKQGQVIVKQDGTGGHAFGLDTYWHPAGGTAPTLPTAAGAVTTISFVVISPTYIHYSALLG